MIPKETLRQIVVRQKKDLSEKKETIKRDILGEVLKWMHDDRVLIITGLKRSGKSTLLKQVMEETADNGYINFEDERLLDFQAKDFEMLNEVLVELYGKCNAYFFDEIQNI